MDVAQLVEWSIPISEVRGSNAKSTKIYIEHLLSTVYKDKNEEKETGNDPFKIVENNWRKCYCSLCNGRPLIDRKAC